MQTQTKVEAISGDLASLYKVEAHEKIAGLLNTGIRTRSNFDRPRDADEFVGKGL